MVYRTNYWIRDVSFELESTFDKSLPFFHGDMMPLNGGGSSPRLRPVAGPRAWGVAA